MQAPRARKKAKKFADEDWDEDYVDEGMGISSAAGPPEGTLPAAAPQRAPPLAPSKDALDIKDVKVIRNELLELYPESAFKKSGEPSFTPEFFKVYDLWIRDVKLAWTMPQFINLMTRLDNGIAHQFKCRRWTKDIANIDNCVCSRCVATGEDWQKRVGDRKAAAQHKTSKAKQKYVRAKQRGERSSGASEAAGRAKQRGERSSGASEAAG
jgi:hypothetical protein